MDTEIDNIKRIRILNTTQVEFEMIKSLELSYGNRGDILKIVYSDKVLLLTNKEVVEDNIKNYDNLIQTVSQGFKPIEFSDELVYTGFTRCRNFLFVVNINNEAYHDFINNSKLIDKKK